MRTFLVQLVTANLRLARDVLRRRPAFAPAFLRVNVSDLHPVQSALLAAMVSLTPGSLTVDVCDDGRTLIVHTVYAGDPERARQSIRALADMIARIAPDRAAGDRAQEERHD
jgi:multicomponent Na+:H+ antiporter subunit E